MLFESVIVHNTIPCFTFDLLFMTALFFSLLFATLFPRSGLGKLKGDISFLKQTYGQVIHRLINNKKLKR